MQRGFVMVSALLLGLSGCASGRMVRLEKDVEELRESLSRAERQRDELQKELERLRAESEQLRDQVAEIRQEESSPGQVVAEPASSVAPTSAPWQEETLVQPGSAESLASQQDLELPAADPGAAPGTAPPQSRALALPPQVVGDSMLASADDLYAEAFQNFQKSSYHKAILQFNVFVERYPSHDLTDNAFYWMGECWYGLRNYPRAIAAFEMVLERFPKGNKAPDSLLKKAYSLQRSGRPREALAAFEELIERFPRSSSASKAQNKVKELQESS